MCGFGIETGCVGVCMWSCKKATEGFFTKNMGIDVSIEPDLDDYSCKFCFGKSPLTEEEDPMIKEPCLSACAMKEGNGDQVCNKVRNR